MRIFRILTLLGLAAVIPMKAGAGPLEVGDMVKYSDLAGNTGGGEFQITDITDAADWIISFCMQKTEYMNFTNNFIVGSINEYTLTDPDDKGGINGQDPISSYTAWLYTQFTDGNLSKYDYANTGNNIFASRQDSADALQHAFWGFEQEEVLDPNNYYVQLAQNYTPSDFGIGDVRVMNMYLYDPTKPRGIGPEAQDQLTRVPEPSTLTLFGVGVVGLVLRRRQRVNH